MEFHIPQQLHRRVEMIGALDPPFRGCKSYNDLNSKILDVVTTQTYYEKFSIEPIEEMGPHWGQETMWACCQCGFGMMYSAVELACMEVSCQHILCSRCPIAECWVKESERTQSSSIPAPEELKGNDERSRITPAIPWHVSRLTEQAFDFLVASASPSTTSPTTFSPRVPSSPSPSSSHSSIFEAGSISTPPTDPEDTGNSEWDNDFDPVEINELGVYLPPANLWAQLSTADTNSEFLVALERGYESWRKAHQNAASEPETGTSVGHDKNGEAQGQTSGATKSSRKRPHSEIDGESGNDEREERPRGGPRPNRPPSDPTPLSPLLACPFWKEDSSHWKECFRYKLKRIRDVKQHLRRNHCRSYCVRCGEEFDDAGALESHYKQEEPCKKIVFHVKWLSELQTKALRESRANPKLSVEKQWYAIWDIVFPEIPKPDSPYLDSTISEDLSSFLEFFRQRGPDIIRETGESLGFHPGLIQERQLLQTFVARIYDRWASPRGHSQSAAAPSPLGPENELAQATLEAEFSWVTPGILDAPSTPAAIGLTVENTTQQEQQIRPQPSVSDDIEFYGDSWAVGHSLADVVQPNVLWLGVPSDVSLGIDTFDDTTIQHGDMPLVRSDNEQVSREQQSSSLQIQNVQHDHDGDLSGFDDMAAYQTGHLLESSSRDSQRAITPAQTSFSASGDNLDLSNTQFDFIQETSLEAFDVDIPALELFDTFLWDQNIDFDGGLQTEDEGRSPTNCG